MGMRTAGTGAIASLAIDHAMDILNELKAIRDELKGIREIETGKRHFELLYGGSGVELVTLQLNATEPIPSGYTFIPERIMAQAPEGAKLQLFENAVTGPNFIEVVANIQEYANVVGGLIIEGPSNIIAVISGMKKSGPVSITVSGQLVKKIPSNNRV